MTREKIIRMAREADLHAFGGDVIEALERFAALVAAAKDAEHAKKLKNDIHSCGPTCTRYTCVAVREAVEAEREACAKVCEEKLGPTATDFYGKTYAAAIRSRKDNT